LSLRRLGGRGQTVRRDTPASPAGRPALPNNHRNGKACARDARGFRQPLPDCRAEGLASIPGSYRRPVPKPRAAHSGIRAQDTQTMTRSASRKSKENKAAGMRYFRMCTVPSDRGGNHDLARSGPTTPTRPPGLPLALSRLERLPCCRTFFAGERLSPSARERVRSDVYRGTAKPR
jgi:hypothetical protein